MANNHENAVSFFWFGHLENLEKITIDMKIFSFMEIDFIHCESKYAWISFLSLNVAKSVKKRLF